jgi:H(+)-transporting ATP synthase subunit D
MRRIEVGRRGADVLEQKRSTLLRERVRLAEQIAEATASWESRAATASVWSARASAAAGPRALRLATSRLIGRATVDVSERSVLGLAIPVSATVEPAVAPDFVSIGGAAVELAAEAHREALASAAALAALRAAHGLLEAELRVTVRRLRAIQRRWIPEHEAALRRLQISLDEAELADIARARWAAGRQP